MQNYVPVIVADITITGGISTKFQLPSNFNTFLYVLEGSVQIGDEKKLLNKDEVGWLDIFGTNADSELAISVGQDGARFVLYAGKPTGEAIVSHGPFIADSSEDILRLYQEYRQGKMKHISSVDETQRLVL